MVDQRLMTADPNFDASYVLPMDTTVPVAVSGMGVNNMSLQWQKPTIIGTDKCTLLLFCC